MAADSPIRRGYHPHATLLVFAALTLLLAVGAFNSNNNLLFWLFGLALSLIIVSGLVSGSMLMGLRIRRLAPRAAIAGHPLRTQYAVRNRNRFMPAFGIRIVERPADPRGTRWPCPAITAFIAYVGPGQTRVVEGLARTHTRGRWTLDRFEALTEFPFGIIRKSLLFSQPASITVRPAAVDPGPLSLPPATPRPVRATHGRASSWHAWVGDEQLAGIRDYAPGDQPGLIAWRASARVLEQPVGRTPILVKHHLRIPPPHQDIIVLLDLHAAPTEAAYERNISLALGAAVRLAGRQDSSSSRVGVRLTRGGTLIAPGPRNLAAITESLIDLPRFGDPPTPWRFARAESRTSSTVPEAFILPVSHLASGTAPAPTRTLDAGGEP